MLVLRPEHWALRIRFKVGSIGHERFAFISRPRPNIHTEHLAYMINVYAACMVLDKDSTCTSDYRELSVVHVCVHLHVWVSFQLIMSQCLVD